MISAIRHSILFFLLTCLHAGGLAGQVQPFVVAPADPVENYEVAAITVDSITVLLSELPEGCKSGGGGALPISTPELTATRIDPTLVSLRWKTFDDDYTNRWILQRRLDQADDFTNFWELAESVFLHGDHIDHNNYTGISYYRLYGISPEGEAVYSPIVAVGNVRRTGQLLVYPNPVTSTANVSLPGVASSAKLTLVDGLGRVIWRAEHPQGGAILIQLPVLESGTFLLRWEARNGEIATTRFVKAGQ